MSEEFLFWVVDLYTNSTIDVATVSENWQDEEDEDYVWYPNLTGGKVEKALRSHEKPGPDWLRYPFNLRKVCGKTSFIISSRSLISSIFPSDINFIFQAPGQLHEHWNLELWTRNQSYKQMPSCRKSVPRRKRFGILPRKLIGAVVNQSTIHNQTRKKKVRRR